MNIAHVFKSECPNVDELFDCDSLDDFILNLKKQSTNVKNYVDHGFQALVEALIKTERRAMRINDYKPIPNNDTDLFVHGIGVKSSKKSKDKVVAVLCCYEDDINKPLTSNANHLTRFSANALEKHGVDKDESKVLRVFTNAIDVHERTIKNFFSDKSIEFYVRADIQALINGNKKFWLRFKNMMKGEVKSHISKKKELRTYQSEAVDAIMKNTRGQVILPTGTGKSLIAIDAICKEIKSNPNKTPVILIATPRIVLTYQLLGETVSYLKSHNIDAQYLNLNSGKFNDDEIKEGMAQLGLPVRDVPSTTNSKEIMEYYQKAQKAGIPFIISSTYQSAGRMNDGCCKNIKVDFIIHDEAHNLVDGIGRFGTGDKLEVHKIDGAREMFFTATPAFSDSVDGTGMNNEALFGKEIYKKSPKAMIDAGEIVPAYIHQVVIDDYTLPKKDKVSSKDNALNTDVEHNIEIMNIVIEKSFDEHLKKVKQYSSCPEKIGAKLLIVCQGEDAFEGFFASKGFAEMKERRKDIKFFGISSKFGAWIDGEHIQPQGGWFKEQFMMSLRNLKQEENAIVLHIDILGEGVDFTGLTGTLPFRDLGVIKSCQTLGRCMRLVPEDRANLYSDKIKADDPDRQKKMIKPFAWVVIPDYSINHKDMGERIMKLAKDIRENLEYMPFEDAIHCGGGSRSFPPGETPIWKGKRPDDATIKHTIENPFFTKLIEETSVEEFFTMMEQLRKDVK